MTHYWNCWLSRTQLEEMGAIEIYPAYYLYTKLSPVCPESLVNYPDIHNHLVFMAGQGFPEFVFLSTGKKLAQITGVAYELLRNSAEVRIITGSKMRAEINNCIYDY